MDSLFLNLSCTLAAGIRCLIYLNSGDNTTWVVQIEGPVVGGVHSARPGGAIDFFFWLAPYSCRAKLILQYLTWIHGFMDSCVINDYLSLAGGTRVWTTKPLTRDRGIVLQTKFEGTYCTLYCGQVVDPKDGPPEPPLYTLHSPFEDLKQLPSRSE